MKRLWLRRTLKFVGVMAILVAAGILFWLRGALYHRFVSFPREQAAWQAIRSQRQPVKDDAGWTEYRGILHSHSLHSHDSEVPFEEILRVLKTTGIDFICLSDHCVEGRADFDLQWRGLHEGKLFIPGFEMRNGFMPFGVNPGVVLSNTTDPPVLARQIADNGGLLFYAHPEQPRDWDRPELVGLEIYNIHVDFKRIRGGVGSLLPDLLLSHRRYPEQIFHSISQRPVEFVRRWDDLNRTRHMTAIAGNDCHQNVGYRAFYTRDGTIRIEDTSPETLKEFRLNWITRPLASLCFGPLEPDRKLFHFQLDPYERMARFVNTHVLARELTEPAVKDALRAGRVFVGFDMVADSAGFRWFATDGTNRAVMGESAAFSVNVRLQARSPLPCRFTIFREGAPAVQVEGYEIEWAPPGPGKYRVEAELKMLKEWIPWVYANPIELRPA
jgi:hypothetical protein